MGHKVKYVKTKSEKHHSLKSNHEASWLKFFTSAGIPIESAQAYASTFSIHEICMDMLLDLKKEYLTEMGITLFGHIIAILRHAKAFHDTLKKTGISKHTKPLSEVHSVPKVAAPVKHVVSKRDASIETDLERPVKPSEPLPRPITQTTQLVMAGKKRKVIESDRVLPAKPLNSQREMIVEKKAKVVECEKKRVFERLGLDSSVSSSTEVDSSGSISPDSVFSRLGGKSGVSSSIQEKKESLQYQGVLKNPGASSRTVVRPMVGKSVTLKSASMTSSNIPMKLISDTILPSSPAGFLTNRKVSIKDRLGMNKRPSPQASSRQLTTKTRIISRQQIPDSSTGHMTKKVSFGSVSQKLIPKIEKSPLKSVSHLYSSLPEVPVYSRLGVGDRITTNSVAYGRKRYV